MAVIRTVLVVSPTPSVGKAVATCAERRGYRSVVVRSFDEGKKLLRAVPDLLITELKLGAFNGLHLAVRASATETPAIVIGEAAFEAEVEQLGATWVSSEAALDGDELSAKMTQLLQGAGANRSLASWYERDVPAGPEAGTWNGPTPHTFH